MSKEIINFYEKLNIKGNKLPKNYSKHRIMHTSMIMAIGGTGTGSKATKKKVSKKSSGKKKGNFKSLKFNF